MKREWLLKVGGMAKAITAIIPIIILGMDGLRITNYLTILRFSLQQGILGESSQTTLVTFLTYAELLDI